MDIERAEPAALAGAEQAIRRFRPRLALAAYHDIDHLWQLVVVLLSAQVAFNPLWFVVIPLAMTIGWVVVWRLGKRRSSASR